MRSHPKLGSGLAAFLVRNGMASWEIRIPEKITAVTQTKRHRFNRKLTSVRLDWPFLQPGALLQNDAIHAHDNSRCATTTPAVARPSHSCSTRPVKGTVSKA